MRKLSAALIAGVLLAVTTHTALAEKGAGIPTGGSTPRR